MGSFVCVFSWWDWRTNKDDAVVERSGLFSFKNFSLVTSLSETSHCWTTCHSWLASDASSSRVVVLGESITNKGNHFLNRISKIGLE